MTTQQPSFAQARADFMLLNKLQNDGAILSKSLLQNSLDAVTSLFNLASGEEQNDSKADMTKIVGHAADLGLKKPTLLVKSLA